MPTPTFDGNNLLIILPAGEPVIDVRTDLYSEWKVWVPLSTNMRFPQAFETSGGRATVPGKTEGRNYFLRNDNGWRIRPAEEDADILFDGNLFPADVTIPIFAKTVGAFNVATRIEFSSLSTIEVVPGDSTAAHMSVAYNGAELRMSVWMARDGVTMVNAISCQLVWYQGDGTHVFTMNSSSPDVLGNFNLIRSQVLVGNASYYCIVTVTDPIGPITTRLGVPTVGT